MSRRTVLSAVSAGNGAFEAAVARRTISPLTQIQRSFTSTPARNATQITHFTPTSSSELDSLLSTIRTSIILPSYLTLAQRKKLYSSKYEKKLQADPIIIEIDGEVLKFRYVNPITDMPSTRKTVISAISKFESDADFANLRPLLEGLNNTKRKLEPDFYAKIIRLCGTKGRIYDVIECARGVKRTGFKLDSSEKANEVLHFVQLNAVQGNWTKSSTEQALRWAEVVVDLLEHELHQAKASSILELQALPLNRDPQVILAPLHLAAALVVKCQVDSDVAVEKVDKLARDVVRLWPEGKGLREVHPSLVYEDPDYMGYFLEANKFVALAAPLLHGLELATQVVKDPEVLSGLRSRLEVLNAEVQEARQVTKAQGKAGRGEDVYETFNAKA
ncbi:hypothetical protein BJ170DRAFT_683612 [Xylariales sp. AK1849]|nr:hypothetical protein BJ170DRAFT_683612 [Xylariales sp. AK1849]